MQDFFVTMEQRIEMQNSDRGRRLLFWLCFGFVCGCGPTGPKLHPVTGMVKVSGRPAAAALVFMHEKGRNALTDPLPFGTCKEDGTFEIETPNIGKGAQEGT